MKPDAMASSFFTQMIRQKRMDRASGVQHASSMPGSGFGAGGTIVDFRAVYDKVATMNAEAHRITDENTLLQDRRRVVVYEERIRDASVYETGCVDPQDHFPMTSRSADKTESRHANTSSDDDGPASRLEANRVIGRALTGLSEKLHLNIDPELKNLSITSVSKETVQQLSEIMYALKNIAGLLDEAVAKGQSLDLGGQTVLDVRQARELGAFVQSQLFKVEIGIGMLGAGEQVRDLLSQKMPLPFGGNIPQALDPAQVTMSQAHSQKVFSEMLDVPSANLSFLVQKIRELCAEYGQKLPGGVNLNVVSSNTSAENGPAFMFDGAVMRALLKIDGMSSVADENALAAKNQKFVLLPGTVNLLTRDAAGTKAAMEQMGITDAAGKGIFGGQINAGSDVKSQGTVYRTLDESVMRQVADKLNMAVRSGIHEIRLQLRPESLGEIKINIRVQGDVVFAKISVESQQIKQIVENNMQFLKDSLSQQHLQAGSLDVNVGHQGTPDPEGDREIYSAGGLQQVSGNEQGSEAVEDTTVAMMATGDETGRRFGDNTVEYFA